MKQLHCRWCGGKIAKRTRMITFGQSNYLDERFEGRPATKADAQKYTNGIITAVRRSADGSYILSAHVWDGESYQSELFCSNAHAFTFAISMARMGFATDAYREAVKEGVSQ